MLLEHNFNPIKCSYSFIIIKLLQIDRKTEKYISTIPQINKNSNGLMTDPFFLTAVEK
jgi:hypothetical protein